MAAAEAVLRTQFAQIETATSDQVGFAWQVLRALKSRPEFFPQQRLSEIVQGGTTNQDKLWFQAALESYSGRMAFLVYSQGSGENEVVRVVTSAPNAGAPILGGQPIGLIESNGPAWLGEDPKPIHLRPGCRLPLGRECSLRTGGFVWEF